MPPCASTYISSAPNKEMYLVDIGKSDAAVGRASYGHSNVYLEVDVGGLTRKCFFDRYCNDDDEGFVRDSQIYHKR